MRYCHRSGMYGAREYTLDSSPQYINEELRVCHHAFREISVILKFKIIYNLFSTTFKTNVKKFFPTQFPTYFVLKRESYLSNTFSQFFVNFKSRFVQM